MYFGEKNNWSIAGKEKLHTYEEDFSWNLVGYDNRRSANFGRIHQWSGGGINTKEVPGIEKQSHSRIAIFFCKFESVCMKTAVDHSIRVTWKLSRKASFLHPLPSHAAESVEWNECSKMSMLITNLYLKILLLKPNSITGQKMKFSIKNFFSKYDQTWRKLRIWSKLLKKSFRENFIFGAAHVTALKSFTKGIPYDYSCSAVQDVINKR